ncbi:MAG TPA: L-erythro-3,5-diaminohexanoate dehydrogenase [Thermoanaerobaculia bacterium]|nr:L-erythro-3,5-diaminohexanoate dehydrogenase [Thermoanaerobaculia bacterium]
MTPHPLGLHRSLDPPGALPQAARRLDASPKPLENELAIAVRALSIDSASFLQLREAEQATGETVRDQILRIVRERGKMQNPVTGSGGMLLGEVAEIGPRHPAAARFRPGDAVASLVSLTLTPLSLESVGEIHSETERVEATGTAILFERTLLAPLPKDFSEAVALAAFDVAGAPAAVLRDASPGTTVLVIGTGKAGLLCLAAARERVGPSGRVLAVEPSPAAAERARTLGFAEAVFEVDARDPVGMLSAVEGATSGRLADLVVNVANAPGTEAASVLCARDDGAVLYFGMATSFSAAALGAEGLAKPTVLRIGNGYVPGHDEATLGLLRRHPALARAFATLAGPAR